MTDAPALPTPDQPVFVLRGSAPPAGPVIVTIPHAGRHYPAWLLAESRVDASTLRRLEDRYVDLVADALNSDSVTVIQAQYARALIDLNRAEDEWDHQLVEGGAPRHPVPLRVRIGLGLVPGRLQGAGPLWRRRLSPAELAARIAHFHRPYHAAITQALTQARARFGRAVLIDLHSMPRQANGTPQMVFGDRYGATASLQLVDALMGLAEGQGLSVARNDPYAGAHSIMRHARPNHGVDAVQVEFDRSLYLDDAGQPVPARLRTIQALFAAMTAYAADFVRGASSPLADAAE